MESIRAIFLATIPHVRPLLASHESGRRWREPSALPEISVGGLAGHLYRGVLTAGAYLDRHAEEGDALISAAEYYHRALDPDRGSERNRSIRARAEQHGAVGQEALLSDFDETVSQLKRRLPAEPTDRAVRVIGDQPIGLDEYLRTRLVEVVVHSDDLAVSIGEKASLPEQSWREAISVLVELARLEHGNVAVLRALSRRERATAGIFPVL